MITIELKRVEEGIVPIYENEAKEKLIDARELFYKLRGEDTKTKFSDWIKERIEKYKFEKNVDFISFSFKNEKLNGGRLSKEYYLTIDTSKEICMIENNENGRMIRKYFIEIEKRYRKIINNPHNIFDFMRIALDEIEKNENKVSYKHFYEDNYIAIIKDITKNEYWQVYFKPLAVKEIMQWFNKNKEEIYYEIQYIRNTKNGKKGEIKEKGYKIENVCYKIM